MSLHNSIVAEDMHTLIRWTHADATARLAQVVTGKDVGKMSRQTDTSPATYWILDSVAPLWVQIG